MINHSADPNAYIQHYRLLQFDLRSSLLQFVQKLYHLLFTRPTQHLSFALNQIAIPRFPESPRNENGRGIGIPSPTQHLSFALNHLS